MTDFTPTPEELERRLQQATEALRDIANGKTTPLWAKMRAEKELAALAGEDDGPPKPQREGDYL